ncbi:unnamed protein product [Penicillium glandicola]
MENERSPLLSQGDKNTSLRKRLCKQLGWHSSQIRAYADETLLLFWSSLPVILAYALQNSLQTCSLLIVGRTSPENLATAAFAYMFATCTSWLIAVGGTTALDTLASSAFTGSSDEGYLGVLLQRAFLVLGLMYIPVTVLWAYSESLFIALGQDIMLAKNTAQFLTYLIPGGLGYIYFEAVKKYLQAQGLMSPGTYVLLIVTPFNAGLNYVLCIRWQLGLLGAPLATGFSYWLCFILLALYYQVLNTVPFGIGVAASARIGNLLGARDAHGASRTAKAAAYLSISLGVLIMTVLMASRSQFGRIFSDDADVILLTSEVMPYVAAFQIADGLNSSCGGCLRGMGRQHIGAAINIVSYYCFALPLGIWLSLHGYGLVGLWIGQCLALYSVGLLEWALVSWSDWDDEVHRAFKRIDQDEGEDPIEQA